MSKKMLIEATHAEETRVVVLDDTRLEELDVETSTKKQLKGNIYLAKIVRVEPSLQAAFVDYGGNRHGFLAFNEIHPDYYQIPVADREALKKELQEASAPAEEKEPEETETSEQTGEVETVSEAETDDVYRPRFNALKKYKIQEVIHHNQIVLVQVTKEERGNKGAALTTYLSLAGRYSVLMPNNSNGGGVSRKISNVADRRKLKKIVESLPIPDGMSVIIRTAGKERTKAEIKRDYDYLIKTWSSIRDKTLESMAPALIHEEGNLIKRTLRDVFSDEIEEILIEGEGAYKTTKNFVKLLMPRQSKKIKQYKENVPLFQAYGIEGQLEEMNNKNVYLKSGGYLVIDQAEALVAIDVNSGRATRERNIEETALKTNLEAADEVARQLRLRDLAGLVVIDFIDMDEMRNNHAVERRLKEALKKDRARIQMGKISGFGLMELSRQRLHSSFLETGHHTCPMCQGRGVVRSVESCAMHALHVLEEAGLQHPSSVLTLTVPLDVALYVLNTKREHLSQIEMRHDLTIKVEGDGLMQSPTDFRLEREGKEGGGRVVVSTDADKKAAESALQNPGKNNRKDRRNRNKGRTKNGHENGNSAAQTVVEPTVETVVAGPAEEKAAQASVPSASDEKEELRNNRHRRNHPRNRFRKDKTRPQEASAGEEKFTVVHQEAMVLFDSHQAVQEPIKTDVVVAKTPEEQAVVAVEPARVKKEAVRKPRKSAAKKKEEPIAPAAAEPVEEKPKKGGWWNKFVS